MKNKTRYVLYVIFLFSTILSYGQETFTICNSFDTTIINLTIESQSIWEIGEPNKSVFDSSYTGPNSIVTDLDSLYPTNDTSRFYAIYKAEEWGGIPNYLDAYLPFEIEFNHRFITDSITDFGSIEMSLDDGNTWYDVLSSEYNATWGSYVNEHIYEGTGDTIYESLEVFGNSSGWVHSKFSKDVGQIIWNNNLNPDSIIIRFSFVTDNIGGNEGWQIDNLCMFMDYINDIKETQNTKPLIYPNPNNGEFSINQEIKPGNLSIINLLGEEVYYNAKNRNIVSTNLPSGIYVIVLSQKDLIMTTKLVIK